MGWFVHEVGTGFEDGSYRKKSDGEGALTSWHGRRPEYRHILYYHEGHIIPDAEFLGVQHFHKDKKKRNDARDLFLAACF